MKFITCRGRLVSLQTPRIMGILNITPDSFYSDSRTSLDKVLFQAEKMLSEGVDFIDIGGYSSRPNADFVSQSDELQRVIPVVEILIKQFPEILISVDTFRSEVALQSIEAGASIINDISAGELDKNMWEVVAQKQVPYIAMHMRGNPQTMEQFTDYQNITKEIMCYFSQKKHQAQSIGLNDIIFDPGFGFAKTLEQNYELFSHLSDFKILETPILVGISRKSMIYNLLKTQPEQALNGTTALNTIALLKGANILRVHDVKQAVECVKIVQAMEFKS